MWTSKVNDIVTSRDLISFNQYWLEHFDDLLEDNDPLEMTYGEFRQYQKEAFIRGLKNEELEKRKRSGQAIDSKK